MDKKRSPVWNLNTGKWSEPDANGVRKYEGRRDTRDEGVVLPELAGTSARRR